MNPFKDITDKHDADVELLHPVTRNPLGAAITIAGPEHPKRKAILADRARRIRRKLERTGKLKLDDPETEEADRIELLAGCTLGPDYARPPVDAPATWRAPHADAADLANTDWWKAFGDPDLDALIDAVEL